MVGVRYSVVTSLHVILFVVGNDVCDGNLSRPSSATPTRCLVEPSPGGRPHVSYCMLSVDRD